MSDTICSVGHRPAPDMHRYTQRQKSRRVRARGPHRLVGRVPSRGANTYDALYNLRCRSASSLRVLRAFMRSRAGGSPADWKSATQQVGNLCYAKQTPTPLGLRRRMHVTPRLPLFCGRDSRTRRRKRRRRILPRFGCGFAALRLCVKSPVKAQPLGCATSRSLSEPIKQRISTDCIRDNIHGVQWNRHIGHCLPDVGSPERRRRFQHPSCR